MILKYKGIFFGCFTKQFPQFLTVHQAMKRGSLLNDIFRHNRYSVLLILRLSGTAFVNTQIYQDVCFLLLGFRTLLKRGGQRRTVEILLIFRYIYKWKEKKSMYGYDLSFFI